MSEHKSIMDFEYKPWEANWSPSLNEAKRPGRSLSPILVRFEGVGQLVCEVPFLELPQAVHSYEDRVAQARLLAMAPRLYRLVEQALPHLPNDLKTKAEATLERARMDHESPLWRTLVYPKTWEERISGDGDVI